MQSTRALLLALLVAVSLVAVPLSAAGAAAGAGASDDGTIVDRPAVEYALAADEHDDDPTTEETIGYAEGYWPDDELPVDERDDAHVTEDELEEVVYRSMARTEEIRELPFQEVPDVEVITREEFREEVDEMFEVSERDDLIENVRYEAKLMVDRDADALEAFEALYGDSVGGYYDPGTGEIVLVSDDPDEVEVDEVTLGHELLHALQDQHFGLDGYERETNEQDHAINGLIEGDAVFVDGQYEDRCGLEWDCLEPEHQPEAPPDIVWGLYFNLIMPYDQGDDYVEYVYDRGGWDAVDELYDEPPASSSEVIRPGEEREPVDVEVEDRSSEAWSPVEPDEGAATQTVGEAGLATMFFHDSVERQGASVLAIEDFAQATPDGGETYVYDQPYTDGWKGDELVVYATDEESVEDSGYVWELEWTSADDADEFLDGYLQLLELHGTEPVDGHENTVELDEGFPGAYHVDRDGETVTIVNAPSVEDLTEIRDDAAPEGEDTIEHALFGTAPDDEADDAADADDGADDAADDDGNPLPGFGPVVALVAALATALLVARR
ncbi:Hvo_1808 family surface protein [Halovivax sp.]|uniref:Hvo_1808 family surface protein n=1 Tax=Halovivax sp. TaxID=1935978 RepID=UPI0025C46253|nr:Hvo_1808 family surface protein [Halovivax sp.]